MLPFLQTHSDSRQTPPANPTCWNKWDSGWFSDIFRCSCLQVIGEAKNVEFNSVGLKCLKESESLNDFGFILTQMPYPLLKYSHTAVCSGLEPMPNFAAASQRRKKWLMNQSASLQCPNSGRDASQRFKKGRGSEANVGGINFSECLQSAIASHNHPKTGF